MPTGNWFTSQTSSGETAWADVSLDNLTSDPASITVDLAFDFGTAILKYNGVGTAGIPAAITNTALVTSVTSESTAGGALEFIPLVVGTTDLTIGPYLAGEAVVVPLAVIDSRGSLPSGVVTRLTAGLIPDVQIGAAPFTFQVFDQSGNALPGVVRSKRLEIEISRPGYVSAAHAALNGVISICPRGVGVSTVTFVYHDATYGRLRISRTIEVLP